MSDIGLPNMEWLLDIFYAICVFGPSLVFGPLFLLIGRWVSGHRRLYLALYFVVSIATVGGILWWWSVWFNDPDMLYWSLPFGLVGTATTYGIYLLLRRLFRRLFPKKLAQ